MTFWKAVVLSVLRFGVIMAVLVGSQYPLAWLRPRFYPDGLNGYIVLVFMLSAIAALIWAGYGWAAVPCRQWFEEWKASHRRELSDTDY